MSLVISPCKENELPELLGVIFARLPNAERSVRIQGLFDLFSKGELSLSGIFCAKRDHQIIGGIFSYTRPDKTVLVWPPGIVEGEDENVRTALYEQMSVYFKETSAEIAIGLCEQWDLVPENEWENAGFSYLSDLLYLVATSNAFPLEPNLGDLVFEPIQLEFETTETFGRFDGGEIRETGETAKEVPELDESEIGDYNDGNNGDNAEQFQERQERTERLKERFFAGTAFQELIGLVDRTYEGTLDFPQLCGISPTEDVLRRYQNDGLFRPELWWKIKQNGQDVGCLLLTDSGVDSPLELTYVGIVPEFRGRGLAKRIVQFALWKARMEGRTMLTVSVDSQNSPALHVYQQAGFQIYDRKGMYWKRVQGEVLDDPAQIG